MEKLQRLKELIKNVQEKRQAYRKAKQKVTARHPVIDLKAGAAPISACKNEYDKVIGTSFSEDTEFSLDCDCFDSDDFCVNRKCPMHCDNMDYMIAHDRYIGARKARREFIKNVLFGRIK